MQIIVPPTEKHEGIFVTDSFFVFIVLNLMKRIMGKHCKEDDEDKE